MTSNATRGVAAHGCGDDLQPLAATPKAAAHGDYAIDLHCHLLNLEVEGLVEDKPEKKAEPELQKQMMGEASQSHNAGLMQGFYKPKLTDIETRLADMDAMGVDVQAVSPSPTQYYYWAEPDFSETIVRKINEKLADVCATHPERFVGLGTVSLQQPKLAAEQAEYAVRKLGLRGIEISTLVNGQDAADRRFEPFWEKMAALDAVVFIHPLGTTLGPRLSEHYLSNIVGQPIETAIALSKMIFDGLFDRHERLKVCAAHGGGYLPLYISRSDHGYAVRPEACGCRLRPSEYLKRIWFDSVVYEPEHLRRLIDQVGVERVVIGTDYPFDMGDYTPHELVGQTHGLSPSDRQKILGLNAAELLGVSIPTSRRA